MDGLEQRIAESFRSQALMTVLGAELVHVGEGEVRIAVNARPELWQYRDRVHAGVLTSILDSACGYAAMTLMPPGLTALTAEFQLRFIRPVADVARYVAIGKVIRPGDALSACRGEIFGEHGPRHEAIAVMQSMVSGVAVAGDLHAHDRGGTGR